MQLVPVQGLLLRQTNAEGGGLRQACAAASKEKSRSACREEAFSIKGRREWVARPADVGT